MFTVKGVYENGEIKLLVTFIEEEEDTVRNISFQ